MGTETAYGTKHGLFKLVQQTYEQVSQSSKGLCAFTSPAFVFCKDSVSFVMQAVLYTPAFTYQPVSCRGV